MQLCRIITVSFAFVHIIECSVIHQSTIDRPSLTLNSIKYCAESEANVQLNDAINFVQQQQQKFDNLNENIAKNAILFMGDGMGIPVLTAARTLLGDEKASLSFEKFPFVAMSKTYCVDQMVPDSTCSGTGTYCSIICSFEC